MKNKNRFDLKKFQSETLEEFLAQKASYGLKGFYETGSKEFESKFEEEIEKERKEMSFMKNQLLNGFIYGLTSFFNFLGKKADRNLKEKEYVNAVKKANEILENRKYFKLIEKQLQEHIHNDLFQELFEIKIVIAVTNLLRHPNFDVKPNAKTFSYLALLVYSGNSDSINKDDLAEFQGKVYRSFLTFKNQKQNTENYKKTGFPTEKQAQKYKKLSFARKAIYSIIVYLSINFGELVRRMAKESDPTDKVTEILENSKVKKFLCSKFDKEISKDFFVEELEAETVRIVTQTLLKKDLQKSFAIAKDERLFKLIVQTILDKGVVNFCSASD